MAEVSNIENITVPEEYEASRKQLVALLQNMPKKTMSADVEGRVVFRAFLRGEDSSTVWVDFMDEYDWMKDDSEMWTMVNPDDRKNAYRVCLSPTDNNYLNGKPLVVIKSDDKQTDDLDNVDFLLAGC